MRTPEDDRFPVWQTKTALPDGIQRTEDAEKKKRKLIPPFHTQYPLSHSSHTNVVVLLFTTYSGGHRLTKQLLMRFQEKMAQASCKPRHSRDPPWGPYLGPGTYASTAASTFVRSPPRNPPQKIVPKPQHEWGDGADIAFTGASSTHSQFNGKMDALAVPVRAPYKPTNNGNPYSAPDWNDDFSTTNRNSFQPFGVVVVATPFRPKEQDKVDVPMELHTTSRDHFVPFKENFRRQPLRPVQGPQPYGSVDDGPFNHTSTSRTAFPPHAVKPYVPALKPKPTLGSFKDSFM